MELALWLENGNVRFQAGAVFYKRQLGGAAVQLFYSPYELDSEISLKDAALGEIGLSYFISVELQSLDVVVTTDMHATIPCLFSPTVISLRCLEKSQRILYPGRYRIRGHDGGFSILKHEAYDLQASISKPLQYTLFQALDRIVALHKKDRSKKITLALSGGVDSAIILAALVKLFPEIKLSCVCLAAANMFSEDEEFFHQLQGTYQSASITFFVKTVQQKAFLQRAALCVQRIEPQTSSVKNVNLATIVSLLSENTDYLILGSGPDEYLSGYANKKRPRMVSVEGLYLESHRNFSSSAAILLLPYLAKEVCQSMLRSEEPDKAELRKVAEALELPPAVVQRRKRAAQFGSGVSRYIKADGYALVSAAELATLAEAGG